jgi:hypothetical protein
LGEEQSGAETTLASDCPAIPQRIEDSAAAKSSD